MKTLLPSSNNILNLELNDYTIFLLSIRHYEHKDNITVLRKIFQSSHLQRYFDLWHADLDRSLNIEMAHFQ